MPLYRGPIYHDITYGAAMTAIERKSDFKLTTDNYDNFEGNWPRYNGSALYVKFE